MDRPEFIQTLVQAAMMYYMDNLTQQEIAKKLGTTRQSVSRLLNEAKSKGIVDIKIKNPLQEVTELSQKLAAHFKIKNAIVVPGDFADESIGMDIVAQKAVEYINNLFHKGYKNIGLSWGKTIYSFIQRYTHSESRQKNLCIFPLIGASNEAAPHFMINEIVRIFAEKTNNKPHFIYIPVNPGSSKEFELFSRTRIYKDISKLWDNIDLAVVGIGSIALECYTLGLQYTNMDEMSTLISSKHIVGDICTHHFDANGNILNIKERPALVCASENNLRNAKRVVALTSGIEKAAAIIGALKTGLITDIIIDERTAKEVIQLFNPGVG